MFDAWHDLEVYKNLEKLATVFNLNGNPKCEAKVIEKFCD